MLGSETEFRIIGFFTHHGPGKKLINKVDQATLHQGLPGGTRTFLEERGMHPNPRWDDEQATKAILEDPIKPVILVSNHTHQMEPYLSLASLPPRKNVSLVGMAGSEKIFGPIAEKQFIQVWHPRKRENTLQKQARQAKNEKSIDESIQMLKAGEMIYIAPDGGDATGNWKKGVVSLVDAARSMDEAYLVMTHVPDTTKKDEIYLALKKRSIKTVRISQAFTIKDIPIPNEITALPDSAKKERLLALGKTMKSYYDDWMATK